MTYYTSIKQEWTAFTEADLLGTTNGSSIGCGDTFVMPASATVTMSTYDNDSTLSGDNYEQATDSSGQYASVDGERVGSQMYAEQYHVLHGSDGKVYYMIEIEVEGYDAPGVGEDYFTFYGAVPPAGVSLTVAQTCNVSGSWVDYRCLGAGETAPANTPPTFTNLPADGIICIDENTSFVIDVAATDLDGDALTYEIVGGRDGAFFEIDAHTGELTFKTSPDFETPQSGGGNNTYDVTIKVSDGKGGTETKALWVKVKDVDETDPDCIVIEAEDMNDWGFKTVHGDNASGGALVKIESLGGTADLSTTFKGASGEYDLTVFAQDENDGQSTIMVKINGQVVGTINLDRDTDGSGSDHGQFSEFTLDNIQINTGDTVSLWAQSNCGEYVRIDKIELCKDGEVCPDGFGLEDFSGLNRGTLVDSQFDGFTLTAQRAGDGANSANDAMIFDSSNPTGGDYDLGYANQGNIIIISEDGDSSDPDDNAHGGTITFDFDNPSDVHDIKLLDIEENGGSIKLYDADGNLIKTVAIPAAGNNSIQTIILDAAGVDSMVIHLAGSGAVDDLCFKPGEAPALGSLSGRFFGDTNRDGLDNDANNAIAGVTVELLDDNGVPTGATTTTDADGNYSFGNLLAGTYGVKFTDPVTGRELTDQNVGSNDAIDSDASDIGGGMSTITGIVVTAGADTPDNDAGVVASAGSISGTYFCDVDRDGIDDGDANGDKDVAGKTVTLLDASGNPAVDIDGNLVAAVQTDAEGNYSFGNLAAGDYQVSFEATEGKEFVAQDTGSDDTVDSDVNPSTGTTGSVTVVAGENTGDVDAGVQDLLGSLSGRFFDDANRDGLDNDANNAIAGVTVELLDENGDPTGATTTTDADGNYSFGDLAAGTYGVKFTDPVTGRELTDQNVGSNDAIDSDASDIGGGMSTITGIVVTAGADTPDNDAGVKVTPVGTEICIVENTTAVVDLDCGESNLTDVGLDACAIRDEKGYDKPAQLTIVYDPDADGINSQGDKGKVSGVGDDDDTAYVVIRAKDAGGAILFEGEVTKGDAITFGPGVGGTLESNTYIAVYEDAAAYAANDAPLQTIGLHTSCSVPIVIGESVGSVVVAGFGFDAGGTLDTYGGTGGSGDAGVTYAIAGGADAALFNVDADTGEVSFIDAPDFENPQDQGANNVYDVIVSATNVDGTVTLKPLEVCVEDDCIKIAENTTGPIVDLDCGTGGNTDIGTDICAVRDKNVNGLGEDTTKPTEITLTLGDMLTNEINSTQGDKLEVGAVQPGDDGDGSYVIRVSNKDNPNDTSENYFNGTVQAGESFTFASATGGRNEFGSETRVHIFDNDGTFLQTINFHTSCSAPLVIGDQYGSVSLTGATVLGMDSGTAYDFGGTDAAGDEGVVYSIQDGPGSDLFTVNADGEVSFIDAPDFENPQGINGTNNYEVVVLATLDDGTVIKKPVEICVEDELDAVCVDENTSPQPIVNINLKVACPVPGADIGTDICAVRDKNENGLGEDTTKPTEITLTLGDMLTNEINSTQGDKLEVGAVQPGDDGDGSYVIRVSNKDNPNDTSENYFNGTVQAGETFTFASATGGRDEFGSETRVHIFDNDGTFLQTINFHTSCSAPLVIGDQYGSVSLTGATVLGKDSGTAYEFGGMTIVELGEGDITYSLSGADAALFDIDPETGEVTFKDAPDYENPQDVGLDNVYNVVVRAEAKIDPTCFTEKPVEICVEDVAEFGSLSGRFFGDTNRDGLDNDANNAIAGVTVELLDDNGVPTGATTTTDADGNYSFGGLLAGTYGVKFTDPVTGRELTDQNVGSNDAIDSDASDIGGGMSTITGIVVTAGADTPDNDAGVVASAGSISGTYFCDVDRDGIDDGDANGDKDVAGKTVTLLDASGNPAVDIDGNLVAAVLTDAEGNYSFGNLAAGDYQVSFEATEGKEFVAQDTGSDDTVDSDVNPSTGTTGLVTVVAGENTGDVDAGVQDLLGSLSGRFFGDTNRDGLDNDANNAIAGVTVELLDENGVPTGATTTTDADGNYSFGGLLAGTYGVKFTDPVTGRELTDQNVGSNDAIDSDASDIGGGMSTITGIVVTAGADTPDNDAGVVASAGSISGTYFCDVDRDGIDDGDANGDKDVAGKTVTLLDASGNPAVDIDGNLVAAVQTDAEGNYSFGNLAAGDYQVSFEATEGKEFVAQDTGSDDTVDSDVNPSTGTTGLVTVVAGENTGDVDAGVQDLLGSLSGRFFGDTNRDGLDNDANNAIAGVTVELLDENGVPTGATTTTDADGNYSFGGLLAGTYGVKFTDPVTGRELTDQNVGSNDAIDSDASDIGGGMSTITGIVVTAGADTPDNDAGVVASAGSISGTYFCDVDRDGIDDGDANGDKDVAGKTVTLLDASGNPAVDIDGNLVAAVLTDAEGNYSFGNLAAGDYQVSFEATEGKEFVAQDTGSDDTVDSDVNPSTGTTGLVTVVAGENTGDVDAGVQDVFGSLSGRFFIDENNNDVDDGEPGVEGVLVELLDASGNPTGATTTTGPNGGYSFGNLLAGTYGVKFTDTVSGRTLVDANVGSDDAIDSDAIDLNMAGMSQITSIVVASGADTPDNDAGVEDAGTASLGDKVFIDTNKNGQQDDGEVGLDGVLVTLFDGNGGVIDTATTESGGMYLFDNLKAGDYVVGFGEPDDFDFTVANTGPAATDSNANQTTGLTGTISLAIGEENLTIDAGVVAENKLPEPQDDAGMVCADEELTINVLANDGTDDLMGNIVDADGDVLSITAVNGQAFNGSGVVTTAAGTIVTLVGGALVFDGEAAYAALDIGESAVETISYTVSDGNGGTANANVEVTFKGDANTLDSFFGSFPASGTYELEYALDDAAPYAEYAFDLRFLNTGDDRLDGVLFEEAYCLDFATAVRTVADDGPDNVGSLFGSQSAEALAAFDSGTISNANGLAGSENLDLINWVISQNFEDSGSSGWEVQFAVWELADNFIAANVNYGLFENTDFAGVQEILDGALALANASVAGVDSFTQLPSGTVELIVEPGIDDSGNIQPFIVGIDFETYDCIC